MTPRQRMDAWARGRWHSSAQIDLAEQVIRINRLRREGNGCRRIAKATGLGPSTVKKWIDRLGWDEPASKGGYPKGRPRTGVGHTLTGAERSARYRSRRGIADGED